jgi:predicted hydrolase (HD superfamily)
MRRDDAITILDEWVTKDFTRTHLFATEAVMRAHAARCGEDVDQWGLAGLLHDADWDTFPDEHPRRIVTRLEAAGEDTIAQAIASHGNNSPQYGERFAPRVSLMDQVLFASDEITGFVMAVAFVRPDGLVGLTPKSIKKKLKDKRFAAQVNREEVYAGPQDIGIEFDDHLQLVIEAMQGAQLKLK